MESVRFVSMAAAKAVFARMGHAVQSGLVEDQDGSVLVHGLSSSFLKDEGFLRTEVINGHTHWPELAR